MSARPPSDPGVGIKEGGARPRALVVEEALRRNPRLGRDPDFVTDDGVRVWVMGGVSPDIPERLGDLLVGDRVWVCASYGDLPIPPSFIYGTPRIFERQGAVFGEERAVRRGEWRWWPPRWRVLSAEQVIERLIDDVLALVRRRARERAALADGVARVISAAVDRRRGG